MDKEITETSGVVIGIPTYKQQHFISNTIRSCLDQTYSNLYVVVGDDENSPITRHLVEQFGESRIRYHGNSDRLGRVGNYHKLLYDYSPECEWYINLDGDDYFTDPTFIDRAITYASRHDNVVFYQANHNLAAVRGAVPNCEDIGPEEVLIDGRDYFIYFPGIQHFIHCATIYRRKESLKVGFYNYDCLFADFHSLVRLALSGKVILSSRKVAVWRQHPDNESKTLSEVNLHKELSSLEDIVTYAEKYIGKSEANRWLRSMEDYYKLIFIYHKSTFEPGWKTIRFIVRHWKFDLKYPKFVLKNLFLMFTGLFGKKSYDN